MLSNDTKQSLHFDNTNQNALGVVADSGSFRDPTNRVYCTTTGKILRGLCFGAAEHCQQLLRQDFFNQWMREHKIVQTTFADPADLSAQTVCQDGWQAVLTHEALPFISYPYEWSFSMLRDAALLQLNLLNTAMQNGWTFKDATPYNIQWQGASPVFIDIPSLIPRHDNESWLAYRQFCMLYLYPLLLKAHLETDFNGLLRANLDGIAPLETARYFRGWRRFRTGVLSHVFLPATVENAIIRQERNKAPAKKRTVSRQSEAVIFGLVHGMTRLIEKLQIKKTSSDWSHYAQTHSYAAADFQAKQEFVKRHVQIRRRRQVWDLGANTGEFSKLCAPHADMVVAVDGDVNAIEQLYLSVRDTGGNILPLVMNLANPSPAQGWAGNERQAFDRRGAPDFILCLALVHHLRLSANIPIPLFLDWLRRLQAEVIIEFVGREDEMTQKLLTNKRETYEDYNLPTFEAEVNKRFTVADTVLLKSGKRKLYHLISLK